MVWWFYKIVQIVVCLMIRCDKSDFYIYVPQVVMKNSTVCETKVVYIYKMLMNKNFKLLILSYSVFISNICDSLLWFQKYFS